MTTHDSIEMALIRRPTVQARTGMPRSTLYKAVANGDFIAPVTISGKSIGWPGHEVDAWVAAKIAGMSEDAIRNLVARLHAKRSQLILA